MKASTLNTTAYRVIRMLQWLCQSPMSIEDFNRCFMADPLIQKTLSEDSLWLYLNTLKMLGCEITRPAPSNNHCYELLYQPFGAPLIEEDIETLAEVKQLAEQQMSYTQVLHLDQCFKKLLQFSTLEQRETMVSDLFKDTRSLDYEGCLPLINRLEWVIEQRKLLFLTYCSSVKGRECFYFLPELMSYQRGVLSLKGSRLGFEESVSLRVDRIQGFEVTEGPELIYKQLTQIQEGGSLIKVRLYETTPLTYTPLGFGETSCYVDTPGERAHMALSIQTRDGFLLKQKLFETGVPFEVIEPESFRADVLETLMAMNHYYDPESLSR